MSNDTQSFESIKSKLRKLQALAEKGYKGEAEAAKRLLDRLCEQVVRPHSARETATSANGTTDLPS